jgi:hypothetical protein
MDDAVSQEGFSDASQKRFSPQRFCEASLNTTIIFGVVHWKPDYLVDTARRPQERTSSQEPRTTKNEQIPSSRHVMPFPKPGGPGKSRKLLRR